MGLQHKREPSILWDQLLVVNKQPLVGYRRSKRSYSAADASRVGCSFLLRAVVLDVYLYLLAALWTFWDSHVQHRQNKSQHHGKTCPARHLFDCLPMCTVALRLNVVGPDTVRARPFRVKATGQPWKTLDIGTAWMSSRPNTLSDLLGPRIPGSSVDCPWPRRYM